MEPGSLSSIPFEPGARKCRFNLALCLLGCDERVLAAIEVEASKKVSSGKFHLPVYFFLGGLLPPNPCWAVTVRSITSFSAGIATPVTITGSPPRMEVLAVGKTNGRWLVRRGGVGCPDWGLSGLDGLFAGREGCPGDRGGWP